MTVFCHIQLSYRVERLSVLRSSEAHLGEVRERVCVRERGKVRDCWRERERERKRENYSCIDFCDYYSYNN